MIRLAPLRVIAAWLAIVLIAGPAAQASDAAPAPAAGVTRSGQTPLRSLLARATAVVVGRPGQPIALDDGRLLVHPLRVEEVLRGALTVDVAPVVEIRGTTQRPALFVDADRAVVLLQPAKRLSYYAQHLPDGPHFEPVAAGEGVIALRSEADLEATRALIEMGVGAAALPAGDEQQAALRALAFGALDARHPRWLADALLELRAIPNGAELSTEEVSTLSGTLRDTALPATLRVQLLDVLAERRWQGAVDVVAATEVDEPSVLEALLRTRAALGSPPDLEELRRHLGDRDPKVRAAAVQALADVDDPDAIRDLGRYATSDPDEGVQTSAIQALGRSGSDAAVPFVKRTFVATAPAVRQASAQALLALGGRRKNEALLDLALTSDTPEARHYAAIALVLSSPADDPAVERLRAEAKDEAIQRLFEHGIELKAHRHDD